MNCWAVFLAALFTGGGDEAGTVDRHVEARWKKVGLKPARPATDEEFLRRVWLDLAGVIPALEEAQKFLRDKDPRKRPKLVEALLASPAYARHWSDLWTVTLVGWFQDEFDGYEREALREWMEEQFRKNVPWNKVGHALLSATGSTASNAPANFAVRYLGEGPEALATRVAKTFLGIRLNCARCHDHPFDAWTREDFFGITSFFARTQPVGIYRDGAAGYIRVVDVLQGEPPQPEGLRAPVPPRFLNGARPVTRLWRQDFALFATRYPQFARAFVNRTWTHLLGRGIVHPPDHFSRKNPPSHPELLEELTRDFIAGGYDVKRLIRTLVLSRVYQLSSENAAFEPAHEKHFLYYVTKPLTPQQLFHSLSRACGTEGDYDGHPALLQAARDGFVAQFADALDNDASDPNAYTETSQSLLLKLSQDHLANAGVSKERGLFKKAMSGPPAHGVGLIYLATLGRRPSAEERKACLAYVERHAAEDDPARPYRHVFYSLVNSHEFNFNH